MCTCAVSKSSGTGLVLLPESYHDQAPLDLCKNPHSGQKQAGYSGLWVVWKSLCDTNIWSSVIATLELLFFTWLLFQKLDRWRRYLKCPKPVILWSRGIITSTQLVTEKWVSKLFKISTMRKELSERNLSGLQMGNWKEPNASDREVNDSKIKGSFISFIQWGKTWTKKFIIQTRCCFCNIHFNDELFQFSFILNM